MSYYGGAPGPGAPGPGTTPYGTPYGSGGFQAPNAYAMGPYGGYPSGGAQGMPPHQYGAAPPGGYGYYGGHPGPYMATDGHEGQMPTEDSSDKGKKKKSRFFSKLLPKRKKKDEVVEEPPAAPTVQTPLSGGTLGLNQPKQPPAQQGPPSPTGSTPLTRPFGLPSHPRPEHHEQMPEHHGHMPEHHGHMPGHHQHMEETVGAEASSDDEDVVNRAGPSGNVHMEDSEHSYLDASQNVEHSPSEAQSGGFASGSLLGNRSAGAAHRTNISDTPHQRLSNPMASLGSTSSPPQSLHSEGREGSTSGTRSRGHSVNSPMSVNVPGGDPFDNPEAFDRFNYLLKKSLSRKKENALSERERNELISFKNRLSEEQWNVYENHAREERKKLKQMKKPDRHRREAEEHAYMEHHYPQPTGMQQRALQAPGPHTRTISTSSYTSELSTSAAGGLQAAGGSGPKRPTSNGIFVTNFENLPQVGYDPAGLGIPRLPNAGAAGSSTSKPTSPTVTRTTVPAGSSGPHKRPAPAVSTRENPMQRFQEHDTGGPSSPSRSDAGGAAPQTVASTSFASPHNEPVHLSYTPTPAPEVVPNVGTPKSFASSVKSVPVPNPLVDDQLEKAHHRIHELEQRLSQVYTSQESLLNNLELEVSKIPRDQLEQLLQATHTHRMAQEDSVLRIKEQMLRQQREHEMQMRDLEERLRSPASPSSRLDTSGGALPPHLQSIVDRLADENHAAHKHLNEVQNRLQQLADENKELKEILTYSGEKGEAAFSPRAVSNEAMKSNELMQWKSQMMRKIVPIRSARDDVRVYYSDLKKWAKNQLKSFQVAMLETSTKISNVLAADSQKWAVANSRAQYELRQRDLERRRLQNTVQELKGDVRAYAIVNNNAETTAKCCVVIDDDSTLTVVRGLHRRDFIMDKVFGPTSDIPDITRNIDDLTESVLDGYNVCLFLYGDAHVTPSKKVIWYGNSKEPGLMSRLAAELFVAAAERRNKSGTKIHLAVRAAEISSNRVRDLCKDDAPPAKSGQRGQPSSASVQTYGDCAPVSVEGSRDFEMVKAESLGRRSVAADSVNRGIVGPARFCHVAISVEALITEIVEDDEGEEVEETRIGRLTFVELASPELHARTAQREKLKQQKLHLAKTPPQSDTYDIGVLNKTFSAVSECMVALSHRQSHVPYRDSKLTTFLRECLGDGCKICLYSLISDHERAFESTNSALLFAERARGDRYAAVQHNGQDTSAELQSHGTNIDLKVAFGDRMRQR